MRKPIMLCLCVVSALALLVTLGSVHVMAADVIQIDVAPNVLNINSGGTVVTVHTDLPYGMVAGASVTLNNVEIDYWKSDNRGYFVAKFVMSEIKNLPLDIGGYNTLTLEGVDIDGVPFLGSQDILVIKITPKR